MTADSKYRQLPSVGILRSFLDYDADAGIFRWRARNDRSHMRSGSIAGSSNSLGYSAITVDGARYMAHRLAWKHFYGSDPAGIIDHINGDPSDNRISNLRVGTQAQNLANKRRKSTKTTAKGVTAIPRPSGTAFVAQAGQGGKTIHIGTFSTEAEAAAAYIKTAMALHGEFANVG